MVSRAMPWLWFSPHSGEGFFLKKFFCLVLVFRSPLLNKYIRVLRDFFSDSVVGNFVFAVSYLFMVLLFVSVVETVLYSSLEGLEALAGTVSGWSDGSEQSSLDACPRSEQSSSLLFSGCAELHLMDPYEKAQLLRQARRRLVVLQDSDVLQRVPWLLEPGDVKSSSRSLVSPVASSSPGGMDGHNAGAASSGNGFPRCASDEALAVRDTGLSRCASDEACGVGDVMLLGGWQGSKAADGAAEADAAIVAATAGESEGIIRLLEVIESDFPPLLNSSHSPNSRLGSLSSACARSVARLCCCCSCTCLPWFFISCCVCCCCTCACFDPA